MLTHYCWRCYGQNRNASGACKHCGREIAPPGGTSFDDRLIWALGHPVSERRLTALRALGTRRVGNARARLCELVSESDPYVAAAALEALVAIDGVQEHRNLLERERTGGTPPVRAVAQRLSIDDGRGPT